LKKKKPTAIPLSHLLGHPDILNRSLKTERRFAENDPRLYDALIDLLTEKAAAGQVFENGRKPGTISPIRAAIRKALAAGAELSNEQLWRMLVAKPPRGFTFYDTKRLGRYIEGSTADKGMEWARFRNICAEERKRLSG
jgi:hypothetical protein